MVKRREIDPRDLDVLLRALTDRQIARLYGMSVEDVRALRLKRRSQQQKRTSGRSRGLEPAKSDC